MIGVSKPEGLRERRRREVRRRILEAARDLLSELDVSAVRADDIADRAGISRATFFNYYPTKSDLLTQLGRSLVTELEALVEAALASYEDLEGALELVLREGFARVKRDEKISRQLLDHLTRTTSSQDERSDLMSRAHAAYQRLMEHAKANGELRGDLDLVLPSELLASVVNGLLINWFNDPSYPVQERIDGTVRFFVGALVAR